jgi:hypothetical protein
MHGGRRCADAHCEAERSAIAEPIRSCCGQSALMHMRSEMWCRLDGGQTVLERMLRSHSE